MIVYADVLMAENFLIGMALVYITAEICNVKLRGRMRILRWLLGSTICSIFSMVIFLSLSAVKLMVLDAIFAFIICGVALGSEKLLCRVLVFCGVTFAMGGLTMALLLATHHEGIYTGIGIYSGNMKAASLSLYVALFTLFAKKMISLMRSIKFYREHWYDVIIFLGEQKYLAKGFWDSGNSLCDPVTGKPVAVATDEFWGEICPEGEFMSKECVIPYKSIGGEGLLKGIRTDYVKVNGVITRGCVIAKGGNEFQPANQGKARCQLLLPRQICIK